MKAHERSISLKNRLVFAITVQNVSDRHFEEQISANGIQHSQYESTFAGLCRAGHEKRGWMLEPDHRRGGGRRSSMRATVVRVSAVDQLPILLDRWACVTLLLYVFFAAAGGPAPLPLKGRGGAPQSTNFFHFLFRRRHNNLYYYYY